MTAEDVIQLYDDLRAKHIKVWVDGGWCVDALLGCQTRTHPDLDIAVEHKDAARLQDYLLNTGYSLDPREDTTEWNYVMQNKLGKLVDIHVFEYDEYGRNIYGIEYPYGSLTGTGIINSREVECISPEWMLTFKTAYTPKDKDRKDVQALAEKYGFIVPATHR
jgi:lincosamide nucleotidyltransferase A/C/D/E